MRNQNLPKLNEISIRQADFQSEEVDESQRTLKGIAVPYNEEVEIWEGYFETFLPNSYRAPANGVEPKFAYNHGEVIGPIDLLDEREDGMYIEARFAETAKGEDAYKLAKMGAVDRLSICFIPLKYTLEEREDGLHVQIIEYTLREVSLVPWPAYSSAKVQEVRSEKGERDMPHVIGGQPLVDLEDRFDSRFEALERAVANLSEVTAPASVSDNRSAGEALKELIRSEEYRSQINELYERAFKGATMEDSAATAPAWLGDLTQISEAIDPLRTVFTTKSLPAEGMSVEYAQLKSDTTKFDEQAKEGDDLAFGKITLETKTAPVKTFGGYTQLSFQVIERTRTNILDSTLKALARAAGRRSAVELASAFGTAVKARATANLTSTKAATALTWSDIAALTVDAAAAFTDEALTLDALVVNKDTFKALAALTASDGRPLMEQFGKGENVIGKIEISTLSGQLVGIKVVPVLSQIDLGANVVGAFVNSEALAIYETPLVSLQDENIINLSKDFSVYRYAAYAAELPAGILPVKLGA